MTPSYNSDDLDRKECNNEQGAGHAIKIKNAFPVVGTAFFKDDHQGRQCGKTNYEKSDFWFAHDASKMRECLQLGARSNPNNCYSTLNGR